MVEITEQMNQHKKGDLNGEFIFFDIGATLIDGAAQSPAKSFRELWNLSESDTTRINDMLMTRDFRDENSLWVSLKEELPFLSSRQKKDVFSVWNEQEKCAVEISGATELIAYLKELGAHIGVISNIWHPFFASFRSCCKKLMDCVDEFFLSYQLGLRKPDPAIFRIALQSTLRLAKRAWMVGDTYYLDIMPALELG